jgi:hypothetical protein
MNELHEVHTRNNKIAVLEQSLGDSRRLLSIATSADSNRATISSILEYRIQCLEYARFNFEHKEDDRAESYIAMAMQGPPSASPAQTSTSDRVALLRKAEAISEAIREVSRIREEARISGTDRQFSNHDESKRSFVTKNLTHRWYQLRLARTCYLIGLSERGDQHLAAAMQGPDFQEDSADDHYPTTNDTTCGFFS